MCGKIGSMAAAAAATAVSDRERYILSLKGRVLKTAKWLCSRLPHGVQADLLEDFVQAGWLGAIRAVDLHDPRKGVLDHYAAWRIKGAILDLMRDMDFLSRADRRRTKDYPEVSHIRIDHPLECGVLPEIEDRRAMRDFGTFEARQELLVRLRRTELDERWKQVLRDYYEREQTMQQIGKTLKVHESRVSQIHSAAISKIREANGLESNPRTRATNG